MELIRLSNKFDRCWADLPALRRAIEEAGVQFNQRTSATLIDRVVASFAIEGHPTIPADQQGTTAVWYVVNEAGKIVGHLLALEDTWDGEKVIYVNQLWARHMPREMQQTATEELDHYARARGCRRIFMYTRRHCPKFWKERFGFVPHRVLYQREVSA